MALILGLVLMVIVLKDIHKLRQTKQFIQLLADVYNILYYKMGKRYVTFTYTMKLYTKHTL